MANELQVILDEIVIDKEGNLLPENLRKGVTALGVKGTFEGGGGAGEVQLFETTEELYTTPAKENDKAVVYKKTVQGIDDGSIFSSMICPETVVLDEPFTDYADVMFRPVEEGRWADMYFSINPESANIDMWGGSGNVQVRYTSTDGKTYTRTDTTGNPLDLGLEMKSFDPDYWNDVVSKFILADGYSFKGLFEAANIPVVISNTIKLSLADIQVNASKDVDIFSQVILPIKDITADGRLNGLVVLDTFENIVIAGSTVRKAKDFKLYWTDNYMAGYKIDDGTLMATMIGTNFLWEDVYEDGVRVSTDPLTVTKDPYNKGYTNVSLVNKEVCYIGNNNNNQGEDGIVAYDPVNVNDHWLKFTKESLVQDIQWQIAPTQFNVDASDIYPKRIALGKRGEVVGNGEIWNKLDSKTLTKIMLPTVPTGGEEENSHYFSYDGYGHNGIASDTFWQEIWNNPKKVYKLIPDKVSYEFDGPKNFSVTKEEVMGSGFTTQPSSVMCVSGGIVYYLLYVNISNKYYIQLVRYNPLTDEWTMDDYQLLGDVVPQGICKVGNDFFIFASSLSSTAVELHKYTTSPSRIYSGTRATQGNSAALIGADNSGNIYYKEGVYNNGTTYLYRISPAGVRTEVVKKTETGNSYSPYFNTRTHLGVFLPASKLLWLINKNSTTLVTNTNFTGVISSTMLGISAIDKDDGTLQVYGNYNTYHAIKNDGTIIGSYNYSSFPDENMVYKKDSEFIYMAASNGNNYRKIKTDFSKEVNGIGLNFRGGWQSNFFTNELPNTDGVKYFWENGKIYKLVGKRFKVANLDTDETGLLVKAVQEGYTIIYNLNGVDRGVLNETKVPEIIIPEYDYAINLTKLQNLKVGDTLSFKLLTVNENPRLANWQTYRDAMSVLGGAFTLDYDTPAPTTGSMESKTRKLLFGRVGQDNFITGQYIRYEQSTQIENRPLYFIHQAMFDLGYLDSGMWQNFTVSGWYSIAFQEWGNYLTLADNNVIAVANKRLIYDKSIIEAIRATDINNTTKVTAIRQAIADVIQII